MDGFANNADSIRWWHSLLVENMRHESGHYYWSLLDPVRARQPFYKRV